MRCDVFLTLDDGMQQLKCILPDQMRRGMKSVGKIQTEVAAFNLLSNQIFRVVGKPGFCFKVAVDPTVWGTLGSKLRE